MVKPITTKLEMKYFEKYLNVIKQHGCRDIDSCYIYTCSSIKRAAYNSIRKECASNRGDHLTVISKGPQYFSTGYIINAGNGEVYFVRHTKSRRVEYKLNKEQQEMIPWLEK